MKKQSTTGFTIIEVVLVLAIAALIFLMVFVALPTLQRNQRDSERRTDAGVVSTAVTDFVSSYRRPLNPSTDLSNLRDFVKDLGQYDVNQIQLDAGGSGAPTPNNTDTIWVQTGVKCDGQGTASGTARQAVVRIQLENDSIYCVDAAS